MMKKHMNNRRDALAETTSKGSEWIAQRKVDRITARFQGRYGADVRLAQ
jgi:hypothetical protein